VRAAGYGGWAIYPDEGSSHIVIEDNVAFASRPTRRPSPSASARSTSRTSAPARAGSAT